MPNNNGNQGSTTQRNYNERRWFVPSKRAKKLC